MKTLSADEIKALRFDVRTSLSPWQLEALVALLDHLTPDELRKLLSDELERRI